MKVIPFKIPKSNRELVRCQEDFQAYFYDKLHQHPEIQLSYILQGEGKLIVGDYIGRFGPGDLYLLGPNVPHVFSSDQAYYNPENGLCSHAKVVFLDLPAFGKDFWAAEEMEPAKDFFERLNGCYKIEGPEQDAFRQQVSALHDQQKLQKVLGVLALIDALMRHVTLRRLTLADHRFDLSEREGRRMDQVIRFLVSESHRPLSLEEVASVANMSREAFCRFFKERTRKTLVTYVNELRVHNACHALQHSDQPIASIALACGFANLALFNRVFLRLVGVTPRQHRGQRQIPHTYPTYP